MNDDETPPTWWPGGVPYTIKVLGRTLTATFAGDWRSYCMQRASDGVRIEVGGNVGQPNWYASAQIHVGEGEAVFSIGRWPPRFRTPEEVVEALEQMVAACGLAERFKGRMMP